MIEDRRYHLGRVPSQPDHRTFQLAEFLRPDRITPPDHADWSTPVTEWGMMGNNLYGNCVIVTAAHELLTWNANESHNTQRITDDAVIDLSRTMGALDGYQIINRLKYWRTNEMWANPLWAFAGYEPADRTAHETAIHVLGAADIGLAMPAAWQGQPLWSTGIGPRFRKASWGYHSVPLVAYDTTTVTCVTWGRLQRITWPALLEYCDEAWGLINPAWITNQGHAPNTLDLPAIHAALVAIGSTPLQLRHHPTQGV
jgi:hypothetical protein